MRFNFRKISALATSALMLGMSAGIAAAATYPSPFVVGGSANAAIVYGTGTGVSTLDLVESGNIQANLQSYMGTGTGTSVSTSGEIVSLDTSGTRIWLNTSLNTAGGTLTEDDLPTVLADSTFSGNVDANLISTITFPGGAAAGGENSGKVIYAKQPKSSYDPTFGISLGSSETSNPLYNISVTFKAINFSHSDSEGESITLFGKDYVISTATDETDLVLFSSSEEITLTKSGAEDPSTTVTVGGADYTVKLLNGDSTSATVDVNGASKDITEGTSKKISGIDVAVKTVTSSDVAGITATLLIGAEKLTFTDGGTVTKGSDDDPVDGTFAYLSGTNTRETGDCTALAVAVYRPSNSDDAISAGSEFVDPVFGSFKVDFAGMSSPEADAARDIITVATSGDKTVTLELTNDDGDSGMFDFAHNESGQQKLLDDSNNTIHVIEMANVTEDQFVFIGNEDYGHLLESTQIYNSSGGYTKHAVKFQDVISGTTYETTFTSQTTGSVTIDGKTYEVNIVPAAGDAVRLKYPTGDSASDKTFVVYPTMETQRGAHVAIYAPLVIPLGTGINGTASGGPVVLNLPDGDGYVSATLTLTGNATQANWTVDTTSRSGYGQLVTGTGINATLSTANITVGQLTYSLYGGGATANGTTTLYLVDPESTAVIDQPAIVIFEERDTKTEYSVVVIDLESDPAGTSTNGVGVNDVLFSTAYGHYDETMASDSDITKDADYYGTVVTLNSDDSDQTFATISYPDSQIYAQIYVGEVGSVVSGGVTGGSTSLGDVLVKDTEVSSVSTKNLIVVGGSCINSAAASLVGGAYCGAGWTDETGAGSGEFIIQSFGDSTITSKIALLVAGWEATETSMASTYLRTQTVTTDAGTKYKGTSGTTAELVVA